MTNRLTDGFRGASMFLTSDQARFYNRLAQYEDTDRTPEEISQLVTVIDLLESDRDAERKMRLGAESEAEQWRRKAITAEEAVEKMLRLVPVSICMKFCKNASPHCGGWGECNPIWKGSN